MAAAAALVVASRATRRSVLSNGPPTVRSSSSASLALRSASKTKKKKKTERDKRGSRVDSEEGAVASAAGAVAAAAAAAVAKKKKKKKKKRLSNRVVEERERSGGSATGCAGQEGAHRRGVLSQSPMRITDSQNRLFLKPLKKSPERFEMATARLFAVLLSATVCLADPNIRGAATQNTTPQVALPPYDCAPNVHSESPRPTLCSSHCPPLLLLRGTRRSRGGCSCARELAAARW